MRQDASELSEISPLELWRHANTPGDPEALAVFQHCLEETVLIWFHDHPGSQTACRLHSERYFVSLAFERLQQTALQRQVACETLSEVLVYLPVSLNGAILQTLRVFSAPEAISCVWSDGQDSFDKTVVWDLLQVRLSSERERRLAYLLSLWTLPYGDCARLPTGMGQCPGGHSAAAYNLHATHERTDL
jgi:hypothetical protein